MAGLDLRTLPEKGSRVQSTDITDDIGVKRPVISTGHNTLSALGVFLTLTFGIAWGAFALLLLMPKTIAELLGPISGSHPLFVLAVYAPAFSAFTLVLRSEGTDGFKRFLSRALLWRCSPYWYAFLLLGIPLIYAAGAAVKGDLLPLRLPFESLRAAAGAIVFMLMLGPMEEFGWRGFALPLLQRRLAPLWAGLFLGIIWGIWHAPAFLLSGTPQSGWSFAPFLVGSVAVSVILTAVFNNSGGSILLAALLHFQLNNPLWPDAQPYDAIFFVAAAIAVTVLDREAMLTRDRAVITVVTAPRPHCVGSA